MFIFVLLISLTYRFSTLFRHSRRQVHCLNHLYTVKPSPPGAMQLRTRGHQFELPAVKYEFNKRNFIVRSLFIMYNLWVFTCIIVIFLFHCTHVRMSYVLNSYLPSYFACAMGGQHDEHLPFWLPSFVKLIMLLLPVLFVC